MATYTRPDVYIEEILTPDNAPQGVSTSIAAFVGATQRGPANKAILVSSFDDFKRVFGDALEKESLFYSVRSFFQNGGSACYIVRLVSSSAIAGGAEAAFRTVRHTSNAGILKLFAGYRGEKSPGVHGVELGCRLTRVSVETELAAVTTNNARTIQVDSTAGFAVGDYIEINGNTKAFKVVKVYSDTPSGVLKHYIDVNRSIGAVEAVNTDVSVLAYNLEVFDADDNLIERFDNLNFNFDSDRFIETVINDDQTGSRNITAEVLYSGTSSTLVYHDILAADLDAAFELTTGGGTDELVGFNLVDDLLGDEVEQTGLYALIAKDQVNLLCVPPSLDATSGIITKADLPIAQTLMLNFCGERLDMFAILDAPQELTMSASGAGSIGEYRQNLLGVDSYWGALYYPHLNVPKTSGSRTLVKIPPSGAIAGLYSRVDAIGAPNGGVASSPAGYGDLGLLRNVSSLEYDISESLHGDLNVMGVNCIKVMERANGTLPGSLVLGARTLSSTNDFRYINVRRMMTFLEKSVKRLGKPFLFRNNGPRLWAEMTNDITSFLRSEFQAGNLAGSSEAQAFFVKIDATTNTAENIQQGILVGEIGVALMRPAEFVVFRFSQIQSGSQE